MNLWLTTYYNISELVTNNIKVLLNVYVSEVKKVIIGLFIQYYVLWFHKIILTVGTDESNTFTRSSIFAEPDAAED